jgi:hypothetical protein
MPFETDLRKRASPVASAAQWRWALTWWQVSLRNGRRIGDLNAHSSKET